MNYHACIFDLDGTLLDTLTHIAETVNEFLASMSYPVHPVEAYRRFVGDGLKMCLLRTLPPENHPHLTVDQMVTLLQGTYRSRRDTSTKPYDGILNLLETLSLKQVSMAILSNKPHALVEEAVNTFFPHIPFVKACGMREDIPAKPDLTGVYHVMDALKLPKEKIVYVGDTNTDMQTATGAGLFAVGVTWGFRDADELKASGADLIIEHPSELLSYF